MNINLPRACRQSLAMHLVSQNTRLKHAVVRRLSPSQFTRVGYGARAPSIFNNLFSPLGILAGRAIYFSGSFSNCAKSDGDFVSLSLQHSTVCDNNDRSLMVITDRYISCHNNFLFKPSFVPPPGYQILATPLFTPSTGRRDKTRQSSNWQCELGFIRSGLRIKRYIRQVSM